MSTSATKNTSKLYISRACITYLFVSLFCLIFSLIYEHFSHGVYSAYMVYAFAIPLCGGFLPFMLMDLTKCFGAMYLSNKKAPPDSTQPSGAKQALNNASRLLYHFALATLTTGSIVQGILEIYGTTNELVIYYWYIGIAEAAGSAFAYVFSVAKQRKKTAYGQ